MDIRGIGRNINSSVHEYETFTKDNQQKNELKKTETVSTDAKGDKIKISSQAKQLNFIDFAVSKIKEDMQKDISADKINKLKAQIKSGAYKIDAPAISDAIFSGTGN